MTTGYCIEGRVIRKGNSTKLNENSVIVNIYIFCYFIYLNFIINWTYINSKLLTILKNLYNLSNTEIEWTKFTTMQIRSNIKIVVQKKGTN